MRGFRQPIGFSSAVFGPDSCSQGHPADAIKLKLTDLRGLDGNTGKRKAAGPNDKDCSNKALSKEPPHGYHRPDLLPIHLGVQLRHDCRAMAQHCPRRGTY